MTRMVEEFVSREDDYEHAHARARARLKRGWDLGTRGSVSWTRDELQER